MIFGLISQTFMSIVSRDSQAELDAEAKAPAISVAVGAVRDPLTLISEQRNMMSMPAIVALSNDPNTQPLHRLLEIFAEGKLEDYKNFEASNSAVFSQYNLSKEDCIRNIRLLSLCSLAAEHEEVPYSVIASTLQVADEAVEKWVIEAVSSWLISAKMDQLQKVVMVEQCVVRKFGIDQWKTLQSKLHAWKKNVKAELRAKCNNPECKISFIQVVLTRYWLHLQRRIGRALPFVVNDANCERIIFCWCRINPNPIIYDG